MTTGERRGWRRRGRGRRREREKPSEVVAVEVEQVEDLTLQVGQQVQFYPYFRPAGGFPRTGVVIRTGDTVDVKWEDGRISHMLQPVLLQPVDDEAPTGEFEEFSVHNYRP
ncbi:MAG: hypothetical protein HY331_19470 [Chloroflexi bacterium]|nr:hypothetical protein [Chloroflexota bacterium]